MIHPTIRREIAERYHRALPEAIRTYLKGRGIPSTVVERQLLGWNGKRITIPVFGREREILGFRYAKSPDDITETTEVVGDVGLDTELYGWDTLARAPRRVVICAREFDRLVLEGNGIAAVASTGGAEAFREEWLPYLEPIKHVYICFDRDLQGAAAAKRVQRLLPRAHVVSLPADVGEHGTVSDFFFVGLRRTKVDFEVLLAGAAAASGTATGASPPGVRELRPTDRSLQHRMNAAKRTVRLHDIVAHFVDLEAAGVRLMGHCPFENTGGRAFTVYPQADVYACSECGASGDVVQFLMDKESMSIEQAVEALERFGYSGELYGTS